MGAWRRTPVPERPQAWFIQETHVGSKEEADDLAEQWRNMWGKKHSTQGPALSYWSYDDSRAGGVAILLNPDVAATTQPWQQQRWTKRVIAVTLRNVKMVNVYAPNNHIAREAFYESLEDWPCQDQPSLIAGDFNCVLSPVLDRWGGKRSGRPESAKLQRLTQRLALEDAHTLTGHADDESERDDPTEFFTYWGPEAASRLDRFYVPDDWTAQVQWVEVREPAVASDHQCVQLHLLDPAGQTPKRRRKRGLVYPIRTSQPDQVVERLLTELTNAGVGDGVNSRTWEVAAGICADCVREVGSEEKKRREQFKHRSNARNRAHLVTRRDLLATTMEEVRLEQIVRMGQRLERTTDQLRWNFKRVSNWEKDQTITEIHRINGEPFERGMSIADKFKSEWKPIVARLHSTTSKDDMPTEFDKFVTIPSERKISPAENKELMQEITRGEVIQAFAELNRHKAAGPDGLNNDFYKDTQALLVPVMVVIGNEILRGEEPPPSFLKGLIIPLRKKGDSVDAMDFRPITLLQTGYKIIATVIANRSQRVMQIPIGDTQQGFVKGRQMLKTVMMMLAMLATANDEPELAAGLSRMILLLDFRKAYDTVAREFLFVALLRFGFSPEFVQMIRRLHDGTTAQFLVNGELSDPVEVVSGIRQGCPLAPLLFILAAEVLALAIKQDRATTGLEVPGRTAERHKFSAFVDDSTVFLQKAQQLPQIMEIVAQFGRLSGLQVQPTKSKIIFLNTAVTTTDYMGIPVLQHGDTTRYLGYAVGTGEMTNVNWAERIRKIQRRLATATQLSTSVDNRVTLLNVIMLPAVLFTAVAFEMPAWAHKQIRNLQKQFLWRHSTSTESSRHKMNPALLFTPRQAGGVGLASVQLACTAQRVKHTIQWLVQRKDSYYYAWREWAFRGANLPWSEGVSPRQDSRGRRRQNGQGPGDSLQELIGPWVAPVEVPDATTMKKYTEGLENLASEAISWNTDEEWVVELQQQLPQPLRQMTQAEQDFWPSYMWTDNPGIVDQTGSMLKAQKYDRIRPCTIAELHVQRTGVRTYSMEIPLTGARAHRQPKLRRWALAILSSAPPLQIGEELKVGMEVRMRHLPQLEADYKWDVQAPGQIIGTPDDSVNPSAVIYLEQQPDGLHWQVQRGSPSAERGTADCQKLQQKGREGSIVFFAHPILHSFHWDVPDTTANKHVGHVIKKQAFRRYKGQGAALGNIVQQLQAAARDSEWQAALLQQTPRQLWAHKHELTDYQVWVGYRMAVRQLNLFNEDRLLDNSCRKLKRCQGHKETLEHIFWACPCAQACWGQLITAWTGEVWEGDSAHGFIRNCASRMTPEVSPPIQKWIRKEFPDEQEEYTAAWRRMWRILCSVSTTSLWIQRNRVVFHQDETNEEASQKEFWSTGIRQLKALALRERRQPEHQSNGIRLQLCINELENASREMSPKGTSPVQPPDRKESALLARLRINQTSSRH